MRRRDFLLSGTMSAASACIASFSFPGCDGQGNLLAAGLETTPNPTVPLQKRICLFTDHLDDFGYSYADVAKMIQPLKIAGPDLTVRSGGLVPPDRVTDELPKAAAAFRDQGLSIPMVSTNLTSITDPTAKPILSTMNKLGIEYYKLGYYHYHDLAKWESDLESQRKNLAALTDFSRSLKIHAGFHNHSGAGIGGALWDGWEFLKPIDPSAVGFYFDPGHASIEGAKHAWKLNFQRISPRLMMIALKDYVWEKSGSGWQTRWCPLGTGMVDWKEFFRLLVQTPFPGPISIHIEYDPGGTTRPERIDRSLAAAQRDVNFVLQNLEQASNTK